jgi:hypothetical protein
MVEMGIESSVRYMMAAADIRVIRARAIIAGRAPAARDDRHITNQRIS